MYIHISYIYIYVILISIYIYIAYLINKLQYIWMHKRNWCGKLDTEQYLSKCTLLDWFFAKSEPGEYDVSIGCINLIV